MVDERVQLTASRRRQVVVGAGAGLLVVAFVGLLVVGLRANRVNRSIDQAIIAGRPRPAPAFMLPLLVNGPAIGRANASPLALADLRGHRVVLNFWASWCVPCKLEAPRLEAAWERHRARGLIVLGLDVQDLRGDALAFVRRYGQTYPSVREAGDGTYQAYGLTGVPETFFIDRRGRARIHWIGEISDLALEQGIEFLDKPRPIGR